MPTLRILADGRPVYATPGAPDRSGVPSFVVGGGETVRLALDFTAWLGVATLGVAAWDVSGATITSAAEAGAVSTALVLVPSQPLASPDLMAGPAVTLGHTLQATDGRVKRTLVRLYPQPASISNVAILDVSVLG